MEGRGFCSSMRETVKEICKRKVYKMLNLIIILNIVAAFEHISKFDLLRQENIAINDIIAEYFMQKKPHKT